MTKVSTTSRWRLSGLQRMLLLYVVLPMVALAGAAISIGLNVAYQLVSERLESDLELVGRAIRLPVSEALQQDDLAAVRANLDAVFDIGQVYGASVYDTDGVLVAATGIAESDLTGSKLAERVVRTGEEEEGFRSVAGRDVYSRFFPVTDAGGQIHGLIQITRRASDFEQSFSELTRYAWLTWAVFALLTIAILVFGHYRGVGRHLEQLVTTMRAVGQGQRQQRSTISGPSELKEVARGLNGMLDSIHQAEQAILAHREHEIELLKQLREQEKMAAIGQLASGVAHELGAPLTVIDGRAQRLLKLHEDDATKHQLTAVRGQVQRLTKLVQQLLAFSRTPVAAPERISLQALLESALQQLRYELTEQAPTLTLPEAYPAVQLWGDPARLELALVNVLRNAVQAAATRVQVAVAVAESDGQAVVHISVQDDGEGLPEHIDKAQLLSPFTTTKAQGEGTGLGLAIVKYVVSAHQGELDLQNHPAGGCLLTLTLPLAAAEEPTND